MGFLDRLRNWVGIDGGMLIGVDLHKSESVLNAAYNDSKGVTAAFNLNLLDHINPILGADFKMDNFSHRAFYNSTKRRIEMHLVSEQAQKVCWNDGSIDFAEGESIHTESSYKYTVESFTELAAAAGLTVSHSWLDDENLFSVHYLQSS